MKVASLPAKFHDKIVDTGTCWTWVAARDVLGYGRVLVGKKLKIAHRAVYELLVGPIPEGMVIDHLCRNPLCVNPAHLEVVTQRENVLRGDHLSAVTVRTNTCKRGHVNDWYVRKNGGRRCASCQRARLRERYQRTKA